MEKERKWLFANPAVRALARHAATALVAVAVSLGATLEVVGPALVAACAELVAREPSALRWSPYQPTPSRGLLSFWASSLLRPAAPARSSAE